MGEYLDGLSKYFAFKGRATRREFWMFVAVSAGITVALTMLEAFWLGFFGWEWTGDSVLANLYSLAVFFPTMAVGARRMQDTGHPGWWLLIPIANLYYAVMDGTPGANKFGPDPKGRDLGQAI